MSIGGNAHLLINGQSITLAVENDPDIKILTTKQVPIQGSNGVEFNENPVPDTISGVFLLTAGISPSVITEARNAVIQIHFGTGTGARVATLDKASYTGDGTVNANKGTLSFEFTGNGRWGS